MPTKNVTVAEVNTEMARMAVKGEAERMSEWDEWCLARWGVLRPRPYDYEDYDDEDPWLYK